MLNRRATDESVFEVTNIDEADCKKNTKNFENRSYFDVIDSNDENEDGTTIDDDIVGGLGEKFVETLQNSQKDMRGGSVEDTGTNRYNEASFTSSTPTDFPGNLYKHQYFTSRKTWTEKKALVQRGSAFGHLEGWVLKSFIVKVGDDLQKEILAMQLIELFQTVFAREQLEVKLRPYQIICTGQSSGLVEFVEGACSVDTIKKSTQSGNVSLRSYFQYSLGLGEIYSPIFGAALQNFIRSLAGYCLVTYLLQVRDRHNANIMIQDDGSLFHIDFGFIFGDSPGFNMNFESAPFKFTKEYVDLMGGLESSMFRSFQDIFVDGIIILL
jgi:phosphatidylinositol 4-kinase B